MHPTNTLIGLILLSMLGCAHAHEEIATVEVSPAPKEAIDNKDALRIGQRYTKDLYEGRLDGLARRFSPQMVRVLPVGSFRSLQQQIVKDLGPEKEVVSEKAVGTMGVWRYRRIVRFERVKEVLLVEWIFRVDGTIDGLRVGRPPKLAPTRYPDYKTKTVLRLPFEGPRFTFWGGPTLAQNYHAAYRDQRFATDLLVMRDSKSHAGDGSKLDDYYAFGKKVLAPGAGVVVSSRNDLPDNPIGKMDPAHALGNHVIIDHQNGEFSFLAHLQQGSVPVSAGNPVESGQMVGLCGNSGNTSEPHIHYHLQDTGVFGKGWGMPAQFRLYRADGEPVQQGEPVKGQVVSPQ